jgi:hypothetical protein
MIRFIKSHPWLTAYTVLMLACMVFHVIANSAIDALYCMLFIVLAYLYTMLYSDFKKLNNFTHWQQHIITQQECRIIERDMKIHDLEKKLNEGKDKAAE